MNTAQTPKQFREDLRARGLERAARFDELIEKASDSARYFIHPRDWRDAEPYLGSVEFAELAECSTEAA